MPVLRPVRRPARRALLTATAAAAVAVAVLPGAAADAAERPAPPGTGPLTSWVVNTRADPGHVRQAERTVRDAGGAVVQSWPQIGVVVAQSRRADFRALVLAHRGARVDSVGRTRTVPVATLPVRGHAPAPTPPGLPPEGTAYDLRQVRADLAHRQPGGTGSRDVLVAVLDTGIDATHPDLAPNVDEADSVGCTSGGRPQRTAAAWRATGDDHGTHVAGTIAAVQDGKGVVGVAPGVRVSSVRVVDEAGLIYPEYAVCGWVEAAESGAAVVNASFYVDPWAWYCGSDPDQAAAAESVARAVAYATRRGVLTVAAANNFDLDLTRVTADPFSPDDGATRTRPLDRSCRMLPAQLPGVVAVSATTRSRARAEYSDYGLGAVTVSAPGDDVWSTSFDGRWAQKSGTSMAAPHVSGVAALLRSAHPGASPARLTALLRAQAQDQPCPALSRRCEGTPQVNGFYGDGVVDALAAVG